MVISEKCSKLSGGIFWKYATNPGMQEHVSITPYRSLYINWDLLIMHTILSVITHEYSYILEPLKSIKSNVFNIECVIKSLVGYIFTTCTKLSSILEYSTLKE